MPSDTVDLGAELVAWARGQLGKPYKYGAVGPGAFDCSGLVLDGSNAVGLKGVPRVSSEQFSSSQRIAYADLQPGDLVFSEWPGDDVAHHGHVAIYAGDNRVIEAPHPGGVVQEVALDSNYLAHVDGYGRITGSGATATNAGLPGGLGPWIGTINPGAGLGAVLGNLIGQNATAASDFLSKFYDMALGAYNFFAAFFRPSTYIRIGAGVAGVGFVVVGLVYLARETKAA